jgi:hypothetical protein
MPVTNMLFNSFGGGKKREWERILKAYVPMQRIAQLI